jgi:phosphodiesterase/alkaline phosphatase D-like protein
MAKIAYSGVAAGDATANSAIIWTRTFDSAIANGTSSATAGTNGNGIKTDLTLQLSTDANFTTIPLSFKGTTDASRDYTLKIDATGLDSGKQYYYRFVSPTGEVSSIGTFKTAIDAYTAAPVRFGFSGDVDGKWRPYASTQNFGSLNLDYFEFLGDTIYETVSTGSPAAGSTATSTPETLLLDYRRKYLENLQGTSPSGVPTTAGGFQGLQTLYASQGNYTALDNHELGNLQLINGGAPLSLANLTGNGTADTTLDVNKTGTFINQAATFKALVKAYSDYQPIREKIIAAPADARSNGTQQLYNAQQWGKNVININTDTRSYRDVRLKTAAGADDSGARADDPNRTLLGTTQLAWLKQTLLDAQRNGTVWKFVSVTDPIDQIEPLAIGSLDSGKSWIGGYRAERNDLLKFIADNKINNVVFLSCDDHQNRINEITYTDNGVVKVLPNALSIVDGPIAAGGPDVITDHSFNNIKKLADTLAAKEVAGGLNPIGLDKNFMGLNNVRREGDPLADVNREAVDFYSPDTFNYTTFDISADGKTLSVNVQGINSFAANTFPEPSAANPIRSILSFNLIAAPPAPTSPTFDFNAASYAVTEGTTGSTNANIRVTRSGSVAGANSVQVYLNDGTAIGGSTPTFAPTTKGASSSATPYMLPTDLSSGVRTTSIFTVGDSVNNKPDGTPYKMVGIPDGLGAFDNGDGTFTLLMGQEIGNTSGIARAHGGTGAFVSSWIINKSDLTVKSGEDLIKKVYNWNSTTQSSDTTASTISFNRFCSADLPSITAYYNAATGKGTQERIFMSGEEGGTTGYAVASVATGANKGNAYVLGKLNPSTNGSGLTAIGGWENLLANPFAQDKTVVIGNNDGGTGVLAQALAVYVGTKTNTGTEVDKAGLTNGVTKFVNVTGNAVEIADATTRATNITNGTAFTLSSTAQTQFSRPEDGVWDPLDPKKYYFVTTDRADQVADGLGTQIGRSRLWRLNFTDITNPDAGGTIDLLLDGTEGGQMFDNLTIDKYGHILLQEDLGGSAHNGKIWQYDIPTDSLKLLAQHDPARFGDVGSAATAPFNNDEESSGIIDAQDILGPGWFLYDTQAHYPIAGELVEGGQLQALFNPDTYKSATKTTTLPTPETSKAPSSSATPYVIPSTPGSGVSVKSILTVGDSVNNKPDGTPYKMVGIPDGLGAFDNGDGTFTLLMNQEIGNTSGIARAHGATGAFVSSWIINKSDLTVKSGEDLIKKVYNWNSATQSSDTTASTISFNRFCSADLPSLTAFYNSKTGLGTQERIFMDGEEGGANGYAVASVATGANKGNAYILGKLNPSTNGSGLTAVGGWENLLANPFAQDKTVVIGNNDGGTGVLAQALAVYVGNKTNTGTEVDRAGLTNGVTKFVNVTGNTDEIVNTTTRATNITNGTAFTLSSTAQTKFSRPEDGAWNPLDPNQYFFVTTDQIDQVSDGLGTQVGRSRLWRLNFKDITNPDAGGTIDLLLDGSEGQVMFDNLTVDKYGHILLQEDTGGAQHNGKIWQYDIATDSLKLIAKHDPARFGDIVGGVQTAPTAPFNIDEESSGIIDAQDILGPGWFLFDTQAHYAITGELVEGGQLQAIFNPDTYKSAVDYKNTPITVSFAPGEQFKDIQIPIAGDTKPEGTESINLSLRNPTGGGVIGTSQSTATLSIANAASTADLIPPTVKSIANVPTTAVTKPVDGIVVEFSEALKAGTFDFNDITLKKDNGTNLVTNAVTVAKLSDTKYQINGLTGLQSASGAYELVVNGTTVQDVAGNAGANSLSAKFSIVPGTVAPFDNKNIDLRDISGKGNFTTQVSYEASYNNYGGFYTVDDTAGKIGALKPGDAGYAEAAVKRAVANISKTEATGNYQFNGGQILAPYLIANGTAADFLAKNAGNTGSASGSLPNAYFIFADANPDKIEHIKAIGNYQYAAEDTFNGGDKDFNDFIIQLNYKPA